VSTPSALRRIVLVGFMGSGKTSVGRALASALGWRFIDFDDLVEAEAGMTVAQLFAERGEAHFRALEQRIAAAALAEDEVVLGSGGGWAAANGRLDELPPGTETFWLRVTAEEAVRRASAQPGRRPLLASADPGRAATQLLAERTPHYRRARWTVDTEHRAIEDVTAGILEILAREYPDTEGA
jgi:shikimate kinase